MAERDLLKRQGRQSRAENCARTTGEHRSSFALSAPRFTVLDEASERRARTALAGLLASLVEGEGTYGSFPLTPLTESRSPRTLADREEQL